MKTGDFQFNWYSANGNDEARYAQILEQNKARIAELETELATLEQTDGRELNDLDMLDLELASNRANAYDLNGATTALSRIDSRLTNRSKDLRDRAKDKQNDETEKELKRSEIEKNIRETQIKRAQAKTQPEKNILDAQLKDLGAQLTANGGTYTPAKYEGLDVNDVYQDFYSNVENTANGLKFKDNVTPEKRAELISNLREIGQDELANKVEAMKTTGEKNEAKQKEAAKRQKIRNQVKAVRSVISKYRNSSDLTTAQLNMLHKAQADADSLARNYSAYVTLENGLPKYTAKD